MVRNLKLGADGSNRFVSFVDVKSPRLGRLLRGKNTQCLAVTLVGMRSARLVKEFFWRMNEYL